jgi:flagellar basal-body rod modification protein FlgD
MNTSPVTQTNASSASTNPVQSTNDMFMQLLTTQLQHQDPLSPVDPNQLTTELVQFNMLDQLTQINQTLTTAFPPVTSTSPSASTSASHSIAGGI